MKVNLHRFDSGVDVIGDDNVFTVVGKLKWLILYNLITFEMKTNIVDLTIIEFTPCYIIIKNFCAEVLQKNNLFMLIFT